MCSSDLGGIVWITWRMVRNVLPHTSQIHTNDDTMSRRRWARARSSTRGVTHGAKDYSSISLMTTLSTPSISWSFTPMTSFFDVGTFLPT